MNMSSANGCFEQLPEAFDVVRVVRLARAVVVVSPFLGPMLDRPVSVAVAAGTGFCVVASVSFRIVSTNAAAPITRSASPSVSASSALRTWAL